jgi:hypothetical protein
MDRRRTAIRRLAKFWKRTRMLYRVLVLIRFSLILGVAGGLVLLFNDQAQDVLHSLGESPDGRIAWFVAGAFGSALLAWWSARVMFYFRFRNPASASQVFPRVKEQLPRMLGFAAFVFIAVALFRASLSYSPWLSAGSSALVILAAVFVILAFIFFYGTAKRRDWMRLNDASRPRDLTSLRQLEPRAWIPLAATGLGGFLLMIFFAYHAVWAAPLVGTAGVALLAVMSMLPVGTLLVYAGNRLHLPVVTALLLVLTASTYMADNHFVRLSSAHNSHDVPASVDAFDQGSAADAKLERYLESWFDGLDTAQGSVPLFIVAAEGGGIRAAYWTALVLGELQDRSLAAGSDFSRHVFAISGVSGGSLGAAVFASLSANESDGRGPRRCAAGFDNAVRGRAERILERDFLAPTVAVMLFPDLFQQLLPIGFLNDRAVAIERSWEAAWDECEEGEHFGNPLTHLYEDGTWNGTPLLFLNSTVVESGQRLITSPVSIDEPQFSEALDGRRVLGPEVPLSTAVHNSARFTYVSPAGTVLRRDRPPTPGDQRREWIRLVDGGYFENSAAVTAAEILRAVERHASSLRTPRGASIKPIVLHLSNDPATTDPRDLLERRKWLNQPLAPLKALLNTRQARGFQAREDLERRAAAHFHFRLCRHPSNTDDAPSQPLPLGWALSRLAREEMHRQLGLLDFENAEGDTIATRNNSNVERVVSLLAGTSVELASDYDAWECPEAKVEFDQRTYAD